MNTKLTLTIDRAVIERAKKYASDKGRSLSDVIENNLKVITDDSQKTQEELIPIVKSLMGAFKSPADFDYEKELSKALAEKYL